MSISRSIYGDPVADTIFYTVRNELYDNGIGEKSNMIAGRYKLFTIYTPRHVQTNKSYITSTLGEIMYAVLKDYMLDDEKICEMATNISIRLGEFYGNSDDKEHKIRRLS